MAIKTFCRTMTIKLPLKPEHKSGLIKYIFIIAHGHKTTPLKQNVIVPVKD